jgi:hypothetical protein
MNRELCRRCGIYTGGPGYCQDCIDVEGGTTPALTIGRRKTGGRMVRSTRRTFGPVENRAQILEEVRKRTVLGETAVEIALAVGVTDRTVFRMRRELGVHGTPKVGADYWADRDATRAQLSAHQTGPNASGIRSAA